MQQLKCQGGGGGEVFDQDPERGWWSKEPGLLNVDRFSSLGIEQVLFLWFSDVLDILGAALDENNIPYASLHNR